MTTARLPGRAQDGGVPDGDPAARPARRRFSALCKLAIVEEHGSLTDAGTKGALRRPRRHVIKPSRRVTPGP
jgi:hypothetical protein